MRGSRGGRDLEFGVATWKSHCGQELGRDMKTMSRHRLVSRRGRDLILVLRPGLGLGKKKKKKGCRDPVLRSGPRLA